jgi:hypothetical protein
MADKIREFVSRMSANMPAGGGGGMGKVLGLGAVGLTGLAYGSTACLFNVEGGYRAVMYHRCTPQSTPQPTPPLRPQRPSRLGSSHPRSRQAAPPCLRMATPTPTAGRGHCPDSRPQAWRRAGPGAERGDARRRPVVPAAHPVRRAREATHDPVPHRQQGCVPAGVGYGLVRPCPEL